MTIRTLLFVLFLVTILSILPQTVAFGAGSIPNFSFLHDKAFRHGDIENLLSELAKSPHRHTGSEASFGLGGTISSFFSALSGVGMASVVAGRVAPKFSKSDIRRTYFGNWLRDYSQAMDIAALSKMSEDTILMIIQLLSFMSFGFATREFKVTPERLGVYLPVEHIDNPKGYAQKEGDARKVNPRLRPPVDPLELEIDRRNGMKKYIATEGASWDTSTAHVRRTLKECIKLGRRVHAPRPRRHKRKWRRWSIFEESTNNDTNEGISLYTDPDENEDTWEALRLLGTALHTLEDLLAHSNWCELALRKLGQKDVFCHVGSNVLVDSPRGRVPPLVTGTFGTADFLHSVLGEATDHLNVASVVDVTEKLVIADSDSASDDAFSLLSTLLGSLPFHLGQPQENLTADDFRRRAKKYRRTEQRDEVSVRKTPRRELTTFDDDEDYFSASEEAWQFLWDVLTWRDDLVRTIMTAIESIPGLSELIEQIVDALNQCVYTLLAPVLSPIIKELTRVLKEQSREVIDSEDQFEVFDNPDASDPTHSIIAKDHVDLILNEPAGHIAQVVVEHTVNLVIKAWYDPRDTSDRTIEQVLEVIHHPYFTREGSFIQERMLRELQGWLDDLEVEDRERTLELLSKENVREGNNRRLARDGETSDGTLSTLDSDDETYESLEDRSARTRGGERHTAEERVSRKQQHVDRRRGEYKRSSSNSRSSDGAGHPATSGEGSDRHQRKTIKSTGRRSRRDSDEGGLHEYEDTQEGSPHHFPFLHFLFGSESRERNDRSQRTPRDDGI